MKLRMICATAVVMLCGLMSCKETTPPEATPAAAGGGSYNAIRNTPASEINNPLRTVPRHTPEHIKAENERVHQLDELDKRIDALRANAKTPPDAMKAQVTEVIDGLLRKEEVARKKVAELQTANADAWETRKNEADAAIVELRNEIQKAFSRFDVAPNKAS